MIDQKLAAPPPPLDQAAIMWDWEMINRRDVFLNPSSPFSLSSSIPRAVSLSSYLHPNNHHQPPLLPLPATVAASKKPTFFSLPLYNNRPQFLSPTVNGRIINKSHKQITPQKVKNLNKVKQDPQIRSHPNNFNSKNGTRKSKQQPSLITVSEQNDKVKADVATKQFGPHLDSFISKDGTNKLQQHQFNLNITTKQDGEEDVVDEATKLVRGYPENVIIKDGNTEMLQQQQPSLNLVKIAEGQSVDVSVFSLSPPPSSLPLPKFSSLRLQRQPNKLSCTAEAAAAVAAVVVSGRKIDAGATDNLCRLLRLRGT